MALANNDIEITAIRRSFGKSKTGETVPAYEIHFTIRKTGDYVATVPIAGFTLNGAMDAIVAIAAPIADLLDTYPTK